MYNTDFNRFEVKTTKYCNYAENQLTVQPAISVMTTCETIHSPARSLTLENNERCKLTHWGP